MSMKLSEITFPIHRIRANLGIREESKITYVTNMSNEEQILDNKNLLGDTLGKRRLRIRSDIYPLYYTISNVETLIKHPNHTFIDDLGKIFKYEKTHILGTIEYKPIERVLNEEGRYPIFWVKGIDYPFKTGNYKSLRNLYAGILSYRGGHLLYELSKEMKPSRRMRI